MTNRAREIFNAFIAPFNPFGPNPAAGVGASGIGGSTIGNRTRVDSSALASVGYDPAAELLELEFRPHRSRSRGMMGAARGRVYRYFNVPVGIYGSLMSASSKGSYFSNYIRGYYDYERVG